MTKYYKVLWNEYEHNGTPVPNILLYRKEEKESVLYLYDLVEQVWCRTGYFSIHDIKKVCHCTEAIEIDIECADILLNKMIMAQELQR